MGLQGSGPISLSDVKFEYAGARTGPISLTSIATGRGLSAPHSMSEFYGTSGSTNVFVYLSWSMVSSDVFAGDTYRLSAYTSPSTQVNATLTINWEYWDGASNYISFNPLTIYVGQTSTTDSVDVNISHQGEFNAMIITIAPTASGNQNFVAG